MNLESTKTELNHGNEPQAKRIYEFLRIHMVIEGSLYLIL